MPPSKEDETMEICGRRKVLEWCYCGEIIKNPVYIGHIVFHKSEVQEPASSQIIFFSKEAWSVCVIH